MRQPSLYETLDVVRRAPPQPPADTLEVYDFFAGAGGFSTGAAQAGCRVVYACDHCPLALETHRRNHPTTDHQCLKLPSREATSRLPTDGRRFHVHCSPPCNALSKMNQTNISLGNAGSRGHDSALNLVEWSLEMMLASHCSSWSLEQVGEREVVETLERVRARHPTRVAYAVINFDQLGVPQSRRRLIAAPPRMLARLLRKCSLARRRSVRDVLPSPRGTHVRHQRFDVRRRVRRVCKPGAKAHTWDKAAWSDYCSPVDTIAPTVRSKPHYWVSISNGEATSYECLLPHELAALQTFPTGYKLPERKADACLQVGNAVPPLVAKLLLQEEARAVAPRPASPSLERSPPTPVWHDPGRR